MQIEKIVKEDEKKEREAQKKTLYNRNEFPFEP